MENRPSLTKKLRDGRAAAITRRGRAWDVAVEGAHHASGCRVVPLPTPVGKGRTALTHVITNSREAPVGITRQEAQDLDRAAAYLDPRPQGGRRRRTRCAECGGSLYPYGAAPGLTGADHGDPSRCYDCA